MRHSELEKRLQEAAVIHEITHHRYKTRTVKAYTFTCNSCGLKQQRTATELYFCLHKEQTLCRRCNALVRLQKVLKNLSRSSSYRGMFEDKKIKVIF